MGFGAISWASKKQLIVSLSTTEVEYVIATTIMCQEVWMRRMLRDIFHDQEGITSIFCDNTSAMALSKNFFFHKRTKHIEAKYHFIRDFINNDELCCSIAGYRNNLLIFSQSHWHVKVLFILEIVLEFSMAEIVIKGECWKY